MTYMRREHRAALAIQTAWRGHTARTEFLRYRRGVVAAQGLWRAKLARRKLRALRAEAREAGKLMQVRGSRPTPYPLPPPTPAPAPPLTAAPAPLPRPQAYTNVRRTTARPTWLVRCLFGYCVIPPMLT